MTILGLTFFFLAENNILTLVTGFIASPEIFSSNDQINA